MTSCNPTIDIYWDGNSDVFYLLEYAPEKGLPYSTGNPIEMNRDDFRLRGLEYILESLNHFNDRVSSPPSGRYAGSKAHRFVIEHRRVSVTQINQQTLELAPFIVEKSGAQYSDPSHITQLRLPVDPETFYKHVLNVFEFSNSLPEPDSSH